MVIGYICVYSVIQSTINAPDLPATTVVEPVIELQPENSTDHPAIFEDESVQDQGSNRYLYIFSMMCRILCACILI